MTCPRGRQWRVCAASALMTLALGAGPSAAQTEVGSSSPQRPGRADPAFSQPSIAPGLDYTVPAEAEMAMPSVSPSS